MAPIPCPGEPCPIGPDWAVGCLEPLDIEGQDGAAVTREEALTRPDAWLQAGKETGPGPPDWAFLSISPRSCVVTWRCVRPGLRYSSFV